MFVLLFAMNIITRHFPDGHNLYLGYALTVG